MAHEDRLPRRDFLKRTASLGAGVAAGLAGRPAAGAAVETARPADAKPKAKVERRNEQPGIVYNRLGRTNFRLSALTFGGNTLRAEGLPVFDAAVQRGVNFVMAHVGGSSKAIGQWLKKAGNREKIFLGLASGPGGLDRHLKVLNTDCVDLLMVPIHKPEAVANDALRGQFEKLKKAGKARSLCVVFHSNVPAVWQAALKAGWYDVLLSTYTIPSRPQLKGLIPQAKKLDLGLLTMKSSRALPKGKSYVSVCKTFLNDGIDSVVRSMRTMKDLEAFLPMAKKDDKTPPAKLASVDCTGQCTLCGACRACPEHIAIQDVLRTYQYYAQDLGWIEQAQERYARIPLTALAPACTDCGQCELVCPQGLPVRRLLREAHIELALEIAGG